MFNLKIAVDKTGILSHDIEKLLVHFFKDCFGTEIFLLHIIPFALCFSERSLQITFILLHGTMCSNQLSPVKS